jgi:hypothetical protein
MGPGGPRGLQIRRRRGSTGTGGFDSHTLPPLYSNPLQESQETQGFPALAFSLSRPETRPQFVRGFVRRNHSPGRGDVVGEGARCRIRKLGRGGRKTRACCLVSLRSSVVLRRKTLDRFANPAVAGSNPALARKTCQPIPTPTKRRTNESGHSLSDVRLRLHPTDWKRLPICSA